MKELNQVREQLASAIKSLDKVIGTPKQFRRYELINRPTVPVRSGLRGFIDYDPLADKFFRFEFNVLRGVTYIGRVSWQLGDGQENAGVQYEGEVRSNETNLELHQGGLSEAMFRLHVGANMLHFRIVSERYERMVYTTTVYNCHLDGFRETLWNRTSGYNHAGFEIAKRVF